MNEKNLTVSSQGAELYCSVRGSGPPCLIMSSMGTTPYERQLPAALDRMLTLVFVDLRGSGRSTGAPTDLTFDRVAADLEAVRAAIGADRVAVLGHSILGAFAIEYGRRRPETVSHVIGAGVPPSGDMAALQRRQQSFFAANASPDRQQALQDNLLALPPEPRLEQFLFAQTPMRFYDARLDPAPLFEGATTNPQLLAHLMGPLVASWSAVDAQNPLRVPLLLAHGRHDYIVPWIEWEPVLPELPTATFQLFERSGHQPFCEEPERFTAVLSDWLKKTAS
jgi:proline iminopeptidase